MIEQVFVYIFGPTLTLLMGICALITSFVCIIFYIATKMSRLDNK